MDKGIVKFMATFFAHKEAWINPNIKVDIDTDGFKFIPKPEVKGLVVFGSQYPLSNRDIPIEQHLELYKAMKEMKGAGVVIMDGDNPVYIDNDGNRKFMK